MFGAVTGRQTVLTTLIVSIANVIAPIQWRRHYGKLSLNDPELDRAKKDMRVELYLWCGAILVFAIAWSVAQFVL